MKIWQNRKQPSEVEQMRRLEQERRDRVRLVSHLVRDDRARHYQRVRRQIALGLAGYYVWQLGNFFFDVSLSWVFWGLLVMPAVASLAYFVGSVVSYNNRDDRHRGPVSPKSPPRPRVVSEEEQAASLRLLRERFQQSRV
jgi:hypothetical protein